MTDEQGPDRLDAADRKRIRQAVEESSRQDEDEHSRQRNTGVAIAVLALVVVGLLIAMVSGAMPHPSALSPRFPAQGVNWRKGARGQLDDAVEAVAGVAEPGDDVADVVELLVEPGENDGHGHR